MYIYYFSNYVYKLYWTNNYSVQSDTKYFQPLKGTLKYFYLLFVIIYYTSRAKTQMFRNTTSKPPIGKMMTFPRSRRKAGIRKSNITLSVDINIRFEFMPPGSTVCNVCWRLRVRLVVTRIVSRSGHHQVPLWYGLGHKCLVDDYPSAPGVGDTTSTTTVGLAEGWSCAARCCVDESQQG